MGRAVVKPARVSEMGTERAFAREAAYLDSISARLRWLATGGRVPCERYRNDEILETVSLCKVKDEAQWSRVLLAH